ncbi:PEPxxWA-CTERM sorting domain-containing protein [Sphingomonas sp. Tas61C01]|uniref:PEPxxWA-CTERM sorting domain-containing protein n=1 Tax=Sphingomonas sp. Tas61C01 TaxID=3458297 RepID=UPI00403E99C9
MNISKLLVQTASAALVLAIAPAAQAATNQTVTSTSQSVSVGGVTFTANGGGSENTGGGSTAVTATRPYPTAGDTGSLEIHGDRSRYVIGALFGNTGSAGFSLSSLSSFTFDWNNDQTTGSQLHAAPVARVIVADKGGERAELIWEYVYNGGAAGVQSPLDTWLNAGADSVWYANLRAPNGSVLSTFKANSQANTDNFNIIDANGNGAGVLGNSGNQINLKLSDWAQYFSSDAKVVGLSFGAGSGFGSGFTGFVDNAKVTTRLGTDAINFETVQSAVPEPSTWAMMLLGMGAVGASMRRRKVTTRVAFSG